MKKNFVIFLFYLFVCLSTHAQSADQVINNLIGQKDWFTLNEKYPQLKDSMQYVTLKLLSEGMLASHFNRPKEAIDKLTDIINNHQQDIGSMGALSLLQTVIEQYEILGKYDKVIEKSKTVIDKLKDAPIDLNWFEYYYRKYKTLSEYPAPMVSRTNNDVTVEFHEEYKGESPFKENNTIKGLIYIPVTIKGNVYQFILDTGSPVTFISKRFAEKIGAKTINGFEDDLGTIARIDSLKIGDGITYKNIIAYVDKADSPDRIVNTSINADAVIGLDFLRLIGEIQFDMNNQRLIFPAVFSQKPEYGSNLLYDNGLMPFAKDDSGQLKFLLDTGNNDNSFYYKYYKKHEKELFNIDAEKEEMIGGSLPSYFYYMAMKVPSIGFECLGKDIKINNAFVAYTSYPETQHDGVLGMGFFKLFNKVTINFKDMFITAE